MFLVARVDAFRAVTDKEIFVHFEPRAVLDNRHAKLFGCARVNGGLINNDIAFFHDSGKRLTGLAQGCQ